MKIGKSVVTTITEDEELEALRADLLELGHGGVFRSQLKKYLEVNKSGLPVVAVDDMTDEETTFANITELLREWPAVTLCIDDAPRGGCWEVGISD